MNAYADVLQNALSATRLAVAVSILPSGLLILAILALYTYQVIQRGRKEKRQSPYRTAKPKKKAGLPYDLLVYGLLLLIPIGLMGWVSSCSMQEAQDLRTAIRRDIAEEAYVTYQGEFEIVEHRSRGLFSTPLYSMILEEDDRTLTLPADICHEQLGIRGEGTFRGTVVYGRYSEIVVAGSLDPTS